MMLTCWALWQGTVFRVLVIGALSWCWWRKADTSRKWFKFSVGWFSHETADSPLNRGRVGWSHRCPHLVRETCVSQAHAPLLRRQAQDLKCLAQIHLNKNPSVDPAQRYHKKKSSVRNQVKTLPVSNMLWPKLRDLKPKEMLTRMCLKWSCYWSPCRRDSILMLDHRNFLMMYLLHLSLTSAGRGNVFRSTTWELHVN